MNNMRDQEAREQAEYADQIGDGTQYPPRPFSTPSRAIILLATLALLLVVGWMMAWLVTGRGESLSQMPSLGGVAAPSPNATILPAYTLPTGTPPSPVITASQDGSLERRSTAAIPMGSAPVCRITRSDVRLGYHE